MFPWSSGSIASVATSTTESTCRSTSSSPPLRPCTTACSPTSSPARSIRRPRSRAGQPGVHRRHQPLLARCFRQGLRRGIQPALRLRVRRLSKLSCHGVRPRCATKPRRGAQASGGTGTQPAATALINISATATVARTLSKGPAASAVTVKVWSAKRASGASGPSVMAIMRAPRPAAAVAVATTHRS